MIQKRTYGSLGTSRAHGAAELKIPKNTGNVTEIHEQLLYPLGSALANSNGLSGLEVGEAQSGKVLVLESKLAQVGNGLGQLGEEKLEAISHEDELSIVSDKAGGSTIVAMTRVSTCL